MTEKCEECGVQAGRSPYRRDIHGTSHVFCCSHCADLYERKTTGHLHH